MSEERSLKPRRRRLAIRRVITAGAAVTLVAAAYCAVQLGGERRNVMLTVLAALFAMTNTLSHLNNLMDRLWPPDERAR